MYVCVTDSVQRTTKESDYMGQRRITRNTEKKEHTKSEISSLFSLKNEIISYYI